MGVKMIKYGLFVDKTWIVCTKNKHVLNVAISGMHRLLFQVL